MSLASSPARCRSGKVSTASGTSVASRRRSSSCMSRRLRRNAAAARNHDAVSPSRSAERVVDLGGCGQRVEFVDRVEHDRSELDADLVLEGVGGLDDLVHRRRLGECHQHHLATGRIVQHLEHLVGLGPDRAAA